MRIAFFADIHANREALTACLHHSELRGIDRYVFLGDYVGYGADPEWVLTTVERYVNEGAVAILGNHDHAVLDGNSDNYNSDAGQVVAWTRTKLQPEHFNFLSGLDLTLSEGEYFFAHANAWAPESWKYVASEGDAERSMNSVKARLSVFGHLHLPSLYSRGLAPHSPATITKVDLIDSSPILLEQDRQWLLVPGAIGQARDGIPAASYSVYDERHSELTFFRVPYDIEAAAKKIERARLPRVFAERLRNGV